MTNAAPVDRTDTYCLFSSGGPSPVRGEAGGKWYALPALSVRHVGPAPELCRVPDSDPACAGVAHVRNEFLTVVWLDRLCGGSGGGAQPRQLLVVGAPQGAWALLVDEVRRLAPLDSAMHPEVERHNGFSACVLGAASHDGLFIRVLDPKRLYQLAERRLRQKWADNSPPSTDVETAASLA